MVTKPSFNTVFFYCNDLAATRRFYSELLGLEEAFGGDQGVSYSVGGMQWFFLPSKDATPVKEWATTPAFEGKESIASWVIEVPSEGFESTVKRLRDDGAMEFGNPTDQEGHKMFFVRDPMGNTVEIYGAPPEQAQS